MQVEERFICYSMTITNSPLACSVANQNAGFALVHQLGDTN